MGKKTGHGFKTQKFYSAAKAAVHHMARSCADGKGGLPEGASTLCLAPVILDTPMNRKFMPKADFRWDSNHYSF